MSNPSVNKRLKERNRQDKQKEKEAKREQRKQDEPQRPSAEGGVDPDHRRDHPWTAAHP